MFGMNPDAWMNVHRQEHAQLMAVAAAPRKVVGRKKRSITLTIAPAPTPACC
jgi:hypothetical protein